MDAADDLYGNTVDQNTLQGGDEAAQQVVDATQQDSGMQSVAAPVPSIQGRKVTQRFPDGSIEVDGGIRYNPNTQTMHWDDGNTRFTYSKGMGKTLARPIPRPSFQLLPGDDGAMHKFTVDPVSGQKMQDLGRIKSAIQPTILKELMDRQINLHPDNGKPVESDEDAMNALREYDSSHGVMTKFQESEAKRLGSLVNSSRNRATTPFLQTYGNYKSLTDLAQKPYNERSGLDDARAIAAFAQIEQPGYQPSQKLIEMVGKSAGIRGAIGVNAERLWGVLNGDPAYDQYKATRLLPDFVIDQMADQAKAASRPRAEEFLKGIEPHMESARAAGIYKRVISEGLVNDAMQLVHPDVVTPPGQSRAIPQPSPQAQDQAKIQQYIQYAQTHPNDPSSQVILKKYGGNNATTQQQPVAEPSPTAGSSTPF